MYMRHFENHSVMRPAHAAQQHRGAGLIRRSVHFRPQDVTQSVGRARSRPAREPGGERKLPGLMRRSATNGHAVPAASRFLWRLFRWVPRARQAPDDEI
jgi:hypothetical protein